MNTDLARQVVQLEGLVDQLPNTGTKSFASDLCKKFNQKKILSPLQSEWVGKLIAQATKGKPGLPKEVVGSMAKLMDLFNVAKSNLKWPKISFSTESGSVIQLSVAGPKAMKPGTINVTDGGSYGSNIWYGRVSMEGEFEKTQKANNEIVTTLKMLSADPHTFASVYGHKSGNCCFCNRGLTDEKSVTVGYGPVCAKNWGLEPQWKCALK